MPPNKIPNGWGSFKLKELGVFSKGSGILKSQLSSTGNCAIRYGELYTRHHIQVKQIHSYISDEVAETAKKIEKGDILFAGSGETIDEIGKSAVYLKNDPCYAGGDIIIFSPKETDSLFLVHLLNMGEARKKLRELGQGQAVVHLYKSDLENLSVTIPHLPEQRRIVSILETWDRAIDEVTNEIYLKEQIKEVVTQKMLFGKNDKSAQFQKNRYLTVPSSWKIVNIGEVAKSISRKNSQNNSLPVLSCTVHRGLVDSLSFFKKQIFSKNLSTYKIVKRNQFVYATNHIEEGSIGLQDIYDEGLVSPMYTVFECDERILPEYLYPLLKTELFRHVFESATSSSVNRRGSLRWSAFSKIKIPLPSLAEQHQIIAIISASKKEIALLEKKLSNLRSQQSYILNALMTGVIRTPETTSAVTKQTTI
jgi:type I restriction enzyme S subunit